MTDVLHSIGTRMCYTCIQFLQHLSADSKLKLNISKSILDIFLKKNAGVLLTPNAHLNFHIYNKYVHKLSISKKGKIGIGKHVGRFKLFSKILPFLLASCRAAATPIPTTGSSSNTAFSDPYKQHWLIKNMSCSDLCQTFLR